MRQSAARRDQITLRRLETLIPKLMDEHDVDCWIATSREYADDAVVMTMLPTEWFSSRRRSILVFLRTREGVRRFSVARYDLGKFYEPAWDPETEPDQWRALRGLLETYSPGTIVVNVSNDFAHVDGLTHSEYEALVSGIGDFGSKVASADPLSVNWLETRLPEERQVMEQACSIAHRLLRRALSAEVITPETTSTDDVVWWLRERVQELGTHVWFQPTVSVQRADAGRRDSFAVKPGSQIIEFGDLVHIDFGIVWDGLNTDQQQHGYVIREGEQGVPAWIAEALASGNRMQDLLTDAFEVGGSGNETLSGSLSNARDEGIDGVVYTHPIGFHGHGAGPTIGLWDQQKGVAGSGDRALRTNTAWSIELMVRVRSPEWDNKTVSIMLEEDAFFDGNVVEYLDGRQTEIWEI